MQDEEVLLDSLGVVAAVRLAGLHDLDVDAGVRPGASSGSKSICVARREWLKAGESARFTISVRSIRGDDTRGPSSQRSDGLWRASPDPRRRIRRPRRTCPLQACTDLQLENGALAGHRHRRRAVGEAQRDLVEGVVGAVVAMVEEDDRARAGASRELRRSSRRRRARSRPRRRARRAAAGRRGRARPPPRPSSIAAGWYSPKPSSPGPRSGGAVVGHVRQRRVAVADAVAERAPALVRDLHAPAR